MLGTACDRANAAVKVQHALAASGAFLRPDTAFLENADERRVDAGINRLAAVALRERLDTRPAAERKYRVIPLKGLGGLLEEDVVALAFDGQFFNFQRNAPVPGNLSSSASAKSGNSTVYR